MPKKPKDQRRGKPAHAGGGNVQNGGTYEMTTDVEFAGPEASISTDVLLDGELLFEADVKWHGLTDELSAALQQIAQRHGIQDGSFETQSFRAVLNKMKRQVVALKQVNSNSHQWLSSQGNAEPEEQIDE